MPPPVRLVIRLPYNRPENAPEDPTSVEWTQEKENLLWEVIAKSRATEGGSTDWQGLSAHLQVPLPYLLYRAQARYEQDLRVIQDVQSALLSQKTADRHAPTSPEPRGGGLLSRSDTRPHLRFPMSNNRNPAGSSNPQTPIIRPTDRPTHLERRISTQTLMETITAKTKVTLPPQARRASPTLSEGSESSEEDPADLDAKKEEEQDALSRRLKELEQKMTRENLGLVHDPPPSAPGSVGSETRSARSLILNPDKQSESSSNSPQGSIPSIPSPTSGSQSSSQILHSQKQYSANVSPTRSPHFAQGRSPRYGHIRPRPSERGSTQGSTASSFSDISETDVSASALESALMTNTRAGSRLTSFARAHFGAAYR